MTIPATQPTQVGDTSIALDGQAGYSPASKSAFGMKTQEPNENMSKPPPSPAKKNIQPVPLSELFPNKSGFGGQKNRKLLSLAPDRNGLVVIETPLPLFAYAFMLPFPFFCMGCCMFQQSRIVLDDNAQTVDVRLRRGHLPGVKHHTLAYQDIGNLAIIPTSTVVNGSRMHKMEIILRDGSRIPTGRLASEEDSLAFCLAVHRFLFGRNIQGDYVEPTLNDLLLR